MLRSAVTGSVAVSETIIILLACAVSMSAQDNMGVPSYRNKGYAGSVSFTDQSIIFLGLDTSHGYMLNEREFIGGGLGFYAAPMKGSPIIFHLYGEYKFYWKEKYSTPTTGVKVGYGGAIKTQEEDFVMPGAEIKVEPYIGWDWRLQNGKGFSLSLGANVFVSNMFIQADPAFYVMPKLNLGFSF